MFSCLKRYFSWTHRRHCTTRRKDKEVEAAAGMLVKMGAACHTGVHALCSFPSFLFFLICRHAGNPPSTAASVMKVSWLDAASVASPVIFISIVPLVLIRLPLPSFSPSDQYRRHTGSLSDPSLHPAHNSTSVLQSSTFNKAYCGPAYRKPELIKPYLWPPVNRKWCRVVGSLLGCWLGGHCEIPVVMMVGPWRMTPWSSPYISWEGGANWVLVMEPKQPTRVQDGVFFHSFW